MLKCKSALQAYPMHMLAFTLLLSLGLGVSVSHAASPLGIGTAEPAFEMQGPFAPIMLFINTWQQAFYRTLTQALIALRTDWHALFTLMSLSFAYGVFHAAGPGHGKAVISSYMVANEVELKRGIMIAILSSLAQSLVAIFTVGLAYVALRGTGITLTKATNAMELASFGLVIAFGVWLLIKKLNHIWQEHRQFGTLPQSPDMAALFAAPEADMPVSKRSTSGLRFQASATDKANGASGAALYCADCRQNHVPDLHLLQTDQFRIKEAWSAILAIGLRPCSGAILVMTFSLLNGLYLGGILSVLAMAAGTAITVSVLALTAAGAKSLALKLSSAFSGQAARVRQRISLIVEIGGAVFIIATGCLLLAASLHGGMMTTGG